MKLNVILKSRILFTFKISLLLLISSSLYLSAHQRSESYSKWVTVKGEDNYSVSVSFTIRLSNLNKLEGPLIRGWENRISSYVISSFTTDPNCFRRDEARVVSSREDDVVKISWLFLCESNLQEIQNNVFFDKDPSHSHIARLESEGNLSIEKLFTNEARNWKIENGLSSKQNSKSSSFKDYISLGIKHISTGYDHLAFLFGLLLLNQRFKTLLLAITGFTLGHSLTLSLAALNYVKPVSGFIEALIGFTIALVGFEFLLRQSRQSLNYINPLICVLSLFFLLYFFISDGRYILGILGLFLFTICYLTLVSKNFSYFFSLFIASIFGLIHGFGFGGFLFEIGFSEENLLKALFGFNLGVEIGQLLAIGLFLIIGLAIIQLNSRHQKYIKSYINPILATVLVSLGTYWFLDRII
tara:strand:+ start:73 stop:1311 length:1239 start_codon:yes stop_codon:yes gene_type:complete